MGLMLNSLYLCLAVMIAGLVSGAFGVMDGVPFITILLLSCVTLMIMIGMRNKLFARWRL